MSDSTTILSLTCERTSSLQKHSSTRICIRVTPACHPPGVTKGFIKGEARSFSTRFKNRDYPATTVEKHLSEVNFADRKKVLEQRNKNASKKILPFVTQYHPALPNLKNILVGKWHLIQNKPYLRNIFKEPSLISYRKGKSQKDTEVRAKL